VDTLELYKRWSSGGASRARTDDDRIMSRSKNGSKRVTLYLS